MIYSSNPNHDFSSKCILWSGIEKGREVFFPDKANDNDSFALADSNSVPYEVKNKTGWVLSEFVQGLKLPPSKLRISILYWPPEPRVS